MTHPKRQRGIALRHLPEAFSLTATASAAMLLVMAAGAAQAQTAPSSGVTETVTVTGIRRGIESAISVKKNADGVVEAISAEDIGKLPDTTIAESLARLPGVTTQRTKDGTASTISIRGLGPDFNGYLLNGREQSSVGDSRAVDLSVYPAELIAGATVYKTNDAALMGAGLAGTIDNKLIDPLAFGRRVFAASVQDIETGKGLAVGGKGKRYSLSYIDQFADRKVGVALGFVRADGTSNQIETGGWGSATVRATLANGTVQEGVKLPAPWGGGLDYKNRRVTDTRDGVAAIFNFKPNKDFSSQVDIFWSKIDTYTKIARLAGGLGSPITNATVVNGTATKGTFNIGAGPTNGGLIAQSEAIFDDDKIQSIGWRTNWNMAPGWTASLDLSHNSAKRVTRDIEAYAGIAVADTLTFDNTAGGTPQLSFGKPLNYTDPALIKVRDQTGWSGVNYPDGSTVPQAGYSKGPTVTDKVSAIRADFRKDLAEGTMFTDLQFGLNYSKRTKDRVTDEGLVISDTALGRALIPFPAGAYVENNIGGTGVNFLTFDPQAGLWPGAALLRKYNDDILSKSWGVTEKVTVGYLKANLDTKLAGVPVRGNVGVQLVNTDQSSAGYRAEVSSNVTLNNPAGALRTDGTKYTDVLPSINLAGDLGAGNVLRMGLAQQIARSTLTDMRNSFAASVNTNRSESTFGRFVGSAGNPNLKPFKAIAFDLSYEKYFGNKAYLSAAGFYKKLDTYITTSTDINYDFTTYARQLGLAIPAAGPRGVFTTSVNGNGGNLSGIELTASLPFNLVAPVLDGFGITASYSDTSSSVKLPNLIGLNPNQQVVYNGITMPLPGLSKKNSKLMLYYERGGFGAFVAYNERSTYVGSVANDQIGGYPALTYIQGSAWVSAQVGYEVQDGLFKGLGLRVEGNNLNKPVYRQLKLDGSIDKETFTGASVAIKLSYKLQ
jgi:iron complex outermembrane recepter protein